MPINFKNQNETHYIKIHVYLLSNSCLTALVKCTCRKDYDILCAMQCIDKYLFHDNMPKKVYFLFKYKLNTPRIFISCSLLINRRIAQNNEINDSIIYLILSGSFHLIISLLQTDVLFSRRRKIC